MATPLTLRYCDISAALNSNIPVVWLYFGEYWCMFGRIKLKITNDLFLFLWCWIVIFLAQMTVTIFKYLKQTKINAQKRSKFCVQWTFYKNVTVFISKSRVIIGWQYINWQYINSSIFFPITLFFFAKTKKNT